MDAFSKDIDYTISVFSPSTCFSTLAHSMGFLLLALVSAFIFNHLVTRGRLLICKSKALKPSLEPLSTWTGLAGWGPQGKATRLGHSLRETGSSIFGPFL